MLSPISRRQILDWSNLKVFVDNKIPVTEKLKFVLERVEKIMRKGEKVGYQHFLIMFSKGSFFRVIKTRDCLIELILYQTTNFKTGPN